MVISFKPSATRFKPSGGPLGRKGQRESKRLALIKDGGKDKDSKEGLLFEI